MAQQTFLIFSLDDFLYALPVMDVKHILRSAAITPLCDAPEFVTGILNVGGWFIPVIDIRRQLHLPPKPLDLSDRMIIAGAHGYTIAFIADTVETVAVLIAKPFSAADDPLPIGMNAESLFPGMEKYITGIAHINSRTVLLYDITALFSETEIRLAADAINSRMVQEPS